MTVDEARNAIDELKAQGISEEGICASLYQMFKNDKLDLDQFEALVKVVGYDLSDEFKAMSPEEQKSQDVGEFGMEDGETEEQSSQENASEDENSGSSMDDNENSDDEEQDNEEEEENPFEKYDNKSSNSFDKDDDDEETKEAKKAYGF